MARKSPWQQFADNYKATKGAFDDMFTGLETKKIMDEEVETLYSPDAGLSHHASGEGVGTGTKWKYGGQIYDKQITPDMLRGLQDKRIGDVMTKFGDREGALKRQIDIATLRGLDDQHALDSGTLAERIRAVKLDNDQKMKSMDLTTAQINKINKLAPLEASKLIAEIAEQKRSTAEKTAKLPDELEILSDKADTSRVVFNEFTSDLATSNREGGLQQTRAELINEKKRIENNAKKLELEGKILESTYDNELATALFTSGQAKNEAEAAEMASKLSLQGNKTLTEFATKMGNNEFESPEAQKEWLMNAWDDTHDPRVKAMIDGITAMELSQITAEGTKTMAEINSALTGKSQNAQKDALVKVIDMQDGIQGNMEFKTDKKTGVVTLYEDGKAVITGAGRGWTKFTEQLYAEFTPLKSLEIAKSNADIRYVNAQAAFKEAEAGMKVTLAESKAWGDHTQTDLFKQLVTMTQAELKERTGFDTLTDYAEDYVKRMRDATGVISYEGWTSPDFPPGG